MNILIVGTGVIGCTYGYAFAKLGHNISHFIREEKRVLYPKNISVSLLDGRCKKANRIYDQYRIDSKSDGTFDLILLSVPNYQLKEAVKNLNNSEVSGTILLFCNIWEDKAFIDDVMRGRNYLIGFPVAGGAFKKQQSQLDCVLFKYIHLEKKDKRNVPNYESLLDLFQSCGFTINFHSDMMQWIWIHIAINMGLVNTVIRNGGLEDSEKAILKVISSTNELKYVIKKSRIYLKIVKKRGVKLHCFLADILPYYIPMCISVPLMKKMFRNNILTREIMLLHSNKNDLLYQYQKLLDSGKALNMSM